MYGARVHSRLSFHFDFCCCRRLLLRSIYAFVSVHIVYIDINAERTQIVLFFVFFFCLSRLLFGSVFLSIHFTS